MEKIIRYKNGNLYSPQQKSFLRYPGILSRTPGDFYVVDADTSQDVTLEVLFLAEVEHVKKEKAYDKVKITYIGES